MTATGREREQARPRLTAEEKLEIAQNAVLDLRAVDPVVLEMSELTVITDYFLICHGTSNVHIRAIADRLLERMEKQRLRPPTEGYREAQWILLDYGDVVVHIFAEEQREFYSLERLWSDAPRRNLSPPETASDERDAAQP
jgi:ribosome-associated protein